MRKALLASEVYVLGRLDSLPVDGVAQPGTNAKLVNFRTRIAGSCPSSRPRQPCRPVAARAGSSPNYLRLPRRELFELTRGARLVLDPDSPYGKNYLPSEVEALLAGREPGLDVKAVTEPMQVQTGAAANLPPELPVTVARFFAQRPTVDSARIGWIATPMDTRAICWSSLRRIERQAWRASGRFRLAS